WPAGIRRQARLGRQSAHHRPSEEPRRAAAHGKDRALVSPLLALPHPVIFRATEQWFISMETPMPGGKGKDDTLRTRTLGEIKSVKWDPAWGEERLSNMIQTRPDWCISRQRVWGVPIAVFLCESCGKPLNDHA